MLQFLKAKQSPIIGIDIASSAVRVLELSLGEHGYCVEQYQSIPLPDNTFDGSNIKNRDALSQCINAITPNLALKAKKIAIAVPDSTVLIKTLLIDADLSAEEVEELVMIEAAGFIPYPLHEVHLDFSIQGVSAQYANQLETLVVACRSLNLTSRIEALQKAGLEVDIVDVESFALARVLPLIKSPDDQRVALVDIGSKYTQIFVLEGMQQVFSKEEAFESVNSASNEFAMAKSFHEQLTAHIKRSLRFYYSDTQNKPIDHIFITGTLAKRKGLSDLIQRQLGINTSIANPFQNMRLNKRVSFESLMDEAPSLLVACGLALRGI